MRRLTVMVAIICGLQASTAACSSGHDESQAKIDAFVEALDSLGIQHSDPEVGSPGLLADAGYDLIVDGHDAGILIFKDADSEKSWVDASDSLGGICVVIDGAALSLNSSAGEDDSRKIAPRIATAVGGQAHPE